MTTRPPIETIKTGDALRQWYWRKDELVAHARQLGVSANAAKFDLLERLAHFLDTGDIPKPAARKPAKTSGFDWHKDTLTPMTVITDSYRNTQNVRRFFKAQLGDGFKFNIAFMEWMTTNSGKTLACACDAYREILKQQKAPGHRTKIKGHNQFNQYTRDFLADHPDAGMDKVRAVWALKIQLPSANGRHEYDPADLELERDTGKGQR